MREREDNYSSSFTPSTLVNSVPTTSGYANLSQEDLKKEIAYLKSLRPTSRSTGDVHSWRVS